ncbi:MAG: FAD-dependent oxidoreductase, partial [Anaerolineae bacterium]|nr:FAD-dependent oxidoreductase [Anaerolineae bacterium]
RIAIVGAGPAGLSCAYHLARLGHEPTVYEAENEVGGLLRHAIPAYRLPRAVLDREVSNVESLGVRFELNSRLGDNLSPERLREADAVFLAMGQGLSRPLGVPGEEAVGVLSGLGLLRRVAGGERPELGRRVVVIGGGNTAVDAARTAIRLGAQVTVVYRRTASQMPAIAEEVEAAEAEGVEFRYLAAPAQVLVAEGRLRGLRCQAMRLGEPDASGRERPVPVPGSEFEVLADTVIAAVGQELDARALAGLSLRVEAGRVPIDEGAATAVRGVFAGGDAATGEGTVAQAIGSGKRAALAIDSWLRTGRVEGLPPLGVAPHAVERAVSAVVVRPEHLNADHIEPAPRPELPQLPAGVRKAGFGEVNLGLTAEAAAAEAARCISCGICIGCDTCYIFCPDVSIARAGPCRYTINYDYCKGCGICAAECPRAAMAVEEEAQ